MAPRPSKSAKTLIHLASGQSKPKPWWISPLKLPRIPEDKVGCDRSSGAPDDYMQETECEHFGGIDAVPLMGCLRVGARRTNAGAISLNPARIKQPKPWTESHIEIPSSNLAGSISIPKSPHKQFGNSQDHNPNNET